MGKKKPGSDLSRRERQIMDVLYKCGEASVAEVQAAIEDAPTYSSVRTLIRVLEDKGWVAHRRVGTKYIYHPLQSKQSASRNAMQHLISTFFGGSPGDAAAAILGDSKSKLTDEELEQLEEIIESARKAKKS